MTDLTARADVLIASVWDSTAENRAAAAETCARYARDADELAEFMEALGLT